jgi:hypothetical protein
MRLWSIHPKYLDTKGLVALWREGLLAQKVLENKTKGYRNHPQLHRFKECKNSLAYIRAYLHVVCDVAETKNYSFQRSKLGKRRALRTPIKVTSGQVAYEWKHLQKKLRRRDPVLFQKIKAKTRPQLHPLFQRKRGPVEAWEVVSS